MSFFIIKIFITAILIVSISEIAKFNDRLGGIIAAMPITTFFILFWLYYENSSLEKISNHMSYTLLYVIPTLPMFITFPYFINKFGFYRSIILSIVITILFVIIVHIISKKFGYKLI
ncbi:MAG: DUF3147 family protein [Proteobacteria bacterium]|jgi:hypothetical protein|nr:DUF3147 family protein [Pseudomonadota bacterium]MDA1135054.1 DUF3147 family protein [Pseudomonadota bacterium]